MTNRGYISENWKGRRTLRDETERQWEKEERGVSRQRAQTLEIKEQLVGERERERERNRTKYGFQMENAVEGSSLLPFAFVLCSAVKRGWVE